MFHQKIAQPASSLHALFHHQADALFNAGSLLAGADGARLVQWLLDDLKCSPTISRKARRQAEKLHRILSLEDVRFDWTDEFGDFVTIDPASPIVEEICILTDALREALDSREGISTGVSAARTRV